MRGRPRRKRGAVRGGMLAKEEVQRALNLWQAESDRYCRNALGGAAASLGDGGDRGGPVEQARRGAASCCEVSDGATAVGAGPIHGTRLGTIITPPGPPELAHTASYTP